MQSHTSRCATGFIHCVQLLRACDSTCSQVYIIKRSMQNLPIREGVCIMRVSFLFDTEMVNTLIIMRRLTPNIDPVLNEGIMPVRYLI